MTISTEQFLTLFLPKTALGLVFPEQWSQPVEHICADHHPRRGVCIQVCQTSRVALLPRCRSWSWFSSSRLRSVSPSNERPALGAVQQHPWTCRRGRRGWEARRGWFTSTLSISKRLATHFGQSSSCRLGHRLPGSPHQVGFPRLHAW